MKKLLLVISLMASSLGQAKDLTTEQVQALHNQVIEQFQIDLTGVINNYNTYIDNQSETDSLNSCSEGLKNQLHQVFHNYHWDTYNNININSVSFQIKGQKTTLRDFSNSQQNGDILSYQNKGKIFTLHSTDKSIIDELTPQIAAYYSGAKIEKDTYMDNGSTPIYEVNFLIVKTMTVLDYEQMMKAINLANDNALNCIHDLNQNKEQSIAEVFSNSYFKLINDYKASLNDLSSDKSLSDQVILHAKGAAFLRFLDKEQINANVYDYQQNTNQVYNVSLSKKDAIYILADEAYLIKRYSQEYELNYAKKQINYLTNEAKNTVKELF